MSDYPLIEGIAGDNGVLTGILATCKDGRVIRLSLQQAVEIHQGIDKVLREARDRGALPVDKE